MTVNRLPGKMLTGGVGDGYDVPLLKQFMEKVRENRLHEKAFFLVGVGPLPSAKTGRWMKNNVPGVHIPEPVLERIEMKSSSISTS